ncbi:MAG TPA: 4Fe-4S dicluster domain-containing protein [Chloroflexi bacterium]|nr:MAG: hypothetical protein B6243_02565 [Anaerolineaceae bacterium 4572_5.2]HEY85988.1 4Fe-4S dicluster domain-containing protein [Chloroflexota bacterium]
MNAQKQNKLSRRDFLKKAGAGAAAIAAAQMFVASPASAGKAPLEDAWGMMIDLTKCTGCNSCALACKEINNLPRTDIVPHKLDSNAYTFVEECETCEVTGEDGLPQQYYVKHQCMHCVHPACVSACTVGALRKTPEGPVVYDADKCIACRYCQYACPFGVPTFDWRSLLGLIGKCDLCAERLKEGQKPACVEACPTGALRFGKRKELLAQARAQIDFNPERYYDHIYGEHEVGGTSVLYLSAVPFTEIGFPEYGPEPIPRYAETVMTATPFTALTVAALATGAHFAFKGRQQPQLAIESDEIGAEESDDQ